MNRKNFQLGYAFKDAVNRVHTKSPFKQGRIKESKSREWEDTLLYGMSQETETPRAHIWRRVLFLVFFMGTFFGLFLKLFDLQVVQGANLRQMADNNRIKIQVIHAPRGVIYDRNGKILAQNDPGFRLMETSSSGQVIYSRISRDQALQMEVDNDPRFKDLEVDSIRSYPMGSEMSQIIGYVGQISQDELNSPEYAGYKAGDLIGRSGIEEEYEKVLKGVDGGDIIEYDAAGKEVQVLGHTDPIPGQNIYLTIDSSLQDYTTKLLANAIKQNDSCCGAAIVSDPNTGQILSLVSLPAYDPTNIAPALTDPNSPMLDRVIAGTYPPGSTFKIVSSLAGLSSGKITPQTEFDDKGVMTLGPYRFTNWYFTQYGKVEGPVNMVKALQRSNDTYFYHLGQIIGQDAIGATAKQMGFGKISGIDLPGEVTGLVPDNAWKVKNYGAAWYPGDTLHEAIGQGFLLVTPIQIQDMISTIAANGKQYPPHLVYKITDPNNHLIKQFKYDPAFSGIFPSDEIKIVRQGLDKVPELGGTAWPFFTFAMPTAGKTGTAEYGDPKDRTHAWYTSYAPAQNPKLASTILVEAGGEGSNVSAPIAKEIYRWYFSPDKTHLLKDVTPQIATSSAKALGE